MGDRDMRNPPQTRSMPSRLVIAMCCATFLIVDVLWLASEYPQHSRVGHAVAGVLRWENRPVSSHPWIDLWIESTSSGPAISTGLVPFANTDDPRTPSSTFTLWPPLPSSGFWAPTRQPRVRGTYDAMSRNFNLQIIPPIELREPIRAFIASNCQSWHLEKYDELLATGGVGTTPILTGYIHNAISLAAAITMLVCGGWLLRDLWRYLRETRYPHGCCRRCGYDRSGLGTESPCPECGEPRRAAQ